MDKRYLKFKGLHETLTYKEIGAKEKPPLTSERVRQILTPSVYKFCKKHRVKYENLCIYCFIEVNYPKVIEKLKTKNAIKIEINRLARPSKDRALTIQRSFLIKYLINSKIYSVMELSKLLRRHYVDIKYLYKRKV